MKELDLKGFLMASRPLFAQLLLKWPLRIGMSKYFDLSHSVCVCVYGGGCSLYKNFILTYSHSLFVHSGFSAFMVGLIFVVVGSVQDFQTILVWLKDAYISNSYISTAFDEMTGMWHEHSLFVAFLNFGRPPLLTALILMIQ